MRILLGIPCFNEENHLDKTLQDLILDLREYSTSLVIIVFDDASTDQSVQIALKAGVKVHANRSNRGLGGNFREIINHAIAGNFDYLLTVDADGQFPSAEVKKVLVTALENNSDVTLASRFLNKEWAKDVPKARVQGNRIVCAIVNLISGKKVSDATCGLRVYSRSSLMMLHPTEKFSYTVESITQILLANMKVTEVPIQVIYFEDRNSTISGSLVRYGMKTIGIASRLALSFALTRLLRKSTWLVSIGIMIEILFLYRSQRTGEFRGNLYICLSGAMIFLIGFTSFFFSLISSKLDLNIRISLMTQRIAIASNPECSQCIESV